MRKKSTLVLLLCLLTVLLALPGCMTTPYKTVTAVNKQSSDIGFYASLIALRKRNYFIDKQDITTGTIVTRKRQHESGSFWWVITCKVLPDNNIQLKVDSNLVKDGTMHKRALHWISSLQRDIEGIILNMPPEEIRRQGTSILKS